MPLSDLELLRAELLDVIAQTADQLRAEFSQADIAVEAQAKAYTDAAVGSVAASAAQSWILSSFDGSTSALRMFSSSDGVAWNPLQDSYYPWPVRDPSIIRYRGKWLIAHTGATGFGKALNSSRGFWVTTSHDLSAWSLPQAVDVMAELQDVTQIWAPEWFIDPQTGLLHAFFSVQRGGAFSIYEKHPLGNLEWSSAQVISIVGQTGSVIDPFVVFVDGTYYLWYKSYTSTSYIHYCSSTSLLGPYSNVEVGNWTGWGDVEGIALVRMADRWRAYMDDFQFSYSLGQINYSDSFDNWQTWTPRQPISTPSQAKHGTAIRI